jgi:hypothetical protein
MTSMCTRSAKLSVSDSRSGSPGPITETTAMSLMSELRAKWPGGSDEFRANQSRISLA